VCYSLWYNVPEDGQNNYPKHVELTGIINKPLLLHLFGCLYYLYQWCTVKKISDNEIYSLIKYIKSVLWRVAKRLSCIENARGLKVKAQWLLRVPHVWTRHRSAFGPQKPISTCRQWFSKQSKIILVRNNNILVYVFSVSSRGTESWDIWLGIMFPRLVPWVRRLLEDVSQRKRRLGPRSADVGFKMDKVTFGKIFVRST
jgi:hypothetical protein